MDKVLKFDINNVAAIQQAADNDIYAIEQNQLFQYAKGKFTQEIEPWVEQIAIIHMVLEAIGTVGALIIIFTMIRSSTFIWTFRIYMILTALSDILLLFVIGGNIAIMTFTGYNPVFSIILHSDISCRAYHVVLGFITHFSMWLHIALMVELLVMAVFPKKLNSVSSLERAHYSTLLMITVLIIINMNYFWTVRRQKEPLGLQPEMLCYFDASFELFETEIYPVIDCAVVGVLPFLCWLVLLLFTARKYYQNGDIRPGGMLISTGEYYKLIYTVSTIYIFGHAPRLVWLISKFSNYSFVAEKNPGISTLQNFHTELIIGDPRVNSVWAAAMAVRIIALFAISKAFRNQFWIGLTRLSLCCRPKTKSKGPTQKSLVSALKTTYNVGTPLISQGDSIISARVANNGARYA